MLFWTALWRARWGLENPTDWKIWWNKQYAIFNGRVSESIPRNTPVFLKLSLHITNKYATYKNNRATANLDELLEMLGICYKPEATSFPDSLCGCICVTGWFAYECWRSFMKYFDCQTQMTIFKVAEKDHCNAFMLQDITDPKWHSK